MCDASTPVVPYECEFIKSQMLHHFPLILRHRPLRVREVIASAGRLAAFPITAQIRHHHKIVLCQRWRDLAPE
jgi:hypothetical protein